MAPGSFSTSGVSLPTLAGGALAGALAFGVLLLVLLPVLRGKSAPSMPKGFLAIATSFAVLTLGLALAYRLLGRVPLDFLGTEVAGFLAGWMFLARWIIAGR